ncbi:MAG: CPBP family intramembrane metalloprotease [Candidatus Brocadiia bacterium]|nr:CPBP family intramembrane metalloprotease [Candidatus Brocadiia bacterium]
MTIGDLFLDETRRLRTVWRLTIFIVSLLGLQVVIGIPVGIAVAVFLLVAGGVQGADALAGTLARSHVLLLCIAALPMAAGALGLAWFCRRFLDRRSLSELGLTRPERRLSASIPAGLAAGAVPIVLMVVALLALGRLEFAGSGASLFTALLVPVFALVAFYEELLFRGYFLQNMLDIRRPVSGMILSSTVFCGMHMLNPGMWASPLNSLNIFLAGAALGLAYLLSRNLWFPTAMHFAWNTFQGPVFGLPVSGVAMDGLLRFERVDGAGALLDGGGFGLEGSVLTLLVLVGMIALFAALILRRHAAGLHGQL